MAGPSRVLLKNTTKLSLNERFTAYRQQAEALGGLGALGAISAIGPLGPMGRLAALGALEQQQQQHQQRQQAASLRNLRLAQQMATRPSVLAALRLKKSSPPVTAQKRRSLKQRLGPTGSIKSRLGLRLGPGPTSWPLVRARLGMRPMGRLPNRGRGMQRGYQRQPRSNGNFMGQFRREGEGRRQRRRGGGRRGGAQPDRQQLDWQLEAYMARTRGHLDAELEAYMAQAEA